MEVKSLENTEFVDILNCFNLSFSDYFVKFEATYDYLWERWQAAGVDYSLSFGVFDNRKLVGFIISCSGDIDSKKTIYNSGTGVIPSHRGQRLISRIYQEAIPYFKEKGFEQSLLEVITENWKAIQVYKKAGFKVTRELDCLLGTWQKQKTKDARGYEIDISGTWTKEEFEMLESTIPTWESKLLALHNRPEYYLAYKLYYQQQLKAIIICGNELNFISQILLRDLHDYNSIAVLMNKICEDKQVIKINNLDVQHSGLLNLFTESGITSSLRQYEMIADLN